MASWLLLNNRDTEGTKNTSLYIHSMDMSISDKLSSSVPMDWILMGHVR